MSKFEVDWLDDTSDAALLSELQRVESLIPNQRLTKRLFDAHSRVSSSTIERRFGSWSAATRNAGLTGALPVYSKGDILDDVRRVAQIDNERTLTIEFYKENGRYSPSHIKRKFGTWQQALIEAGYGNRYSGQIVTDKMKSQDGRDISKDKIITVLTEIAGRLGRESLSATDIEQNSNLRQPLIYRRFGSLLDALRAAGLEPVAHGRRYSDDEIFDNLRNIWIHFGRAPTVVEMNFPPSTIGANAYLKRFGGWRNALRIFIEKANAGLDGHSPEIEAPSSAIATSAEDSVKEARVIAASLSKPKRSRSKRIPPEDRRQPSKGLRFSIFYRDKFACQLCGDGRPNCILHIDHITPFANGGKTAADNLRTLCASCNIGRGNRYDV